MNVSPLSSNPFGPPHRALWGATILALGLLFLGVYVFPQHRVTFGIIEAEPLVSAPPPRRLPPVKPIATDPWDTSTPQRGPSMAAHKRAHRGLGEHSLTVTEEAGKVVYKVQFTQSGDIITIDAETGKLLDVEIPAASF